MQDVFYDTGEGGGFLIYERKLCWGDSSEGVCSEYGTASSSTLNSNLLTQRYSNPLRLTERELFSRRLGRIKINLVLPCRMD